MTNLPLDALRTFEAASKFGSFKLAADELCVTPAAISHQIGNLETHLHTALFIRQHRSLLLTPAGERLRLAVSAAFASLDKCVRELTEDGLVGGFATLRVSAAPSFATKWLAPRLHRFQALHPSIELQLHSSDALMDLVGERNIDFAVRYGKQPVDPELRSIELCHPKIWSPSVRLLWSIADCCECHAIYWSSLCCEPRRRPPAAKTQTRWAGRRGLMPPVWTNLRRVAHCLATPSWRSRRPSRGVASPSRRCSW